MADSPPSREIEESDIEIQRQSSLNSDHANANGCNKAYAFIRKLGAGLQSLAALLFSNISKAILLRAGRVENGLLDTELLIVQKAYGSILKLLTVLAIVDIGVITVLAQGIRLHCVHWWIPFSLELIVSVAVAIATSCQLKKMTRSSRQMVRSVAMLGGLCATSTIILISCRVLLCQS